jgi:hypothetical protein
MPQAFSLKGGMSLCRKERRITLTCTILVLGTLPVMTLELSFSWANWWTQPNSGIQGPQPEKLP